MEHKSIQAFVRHAAVLLVATIGIGATSCGRQPISYTVLIPKGYMGWCHIDFDSPDAPPLPYRDGTYILRVPISGRLRTSSPNRTPKRTGFYIYDGSTTRTITGSDAQPDILGFWGASIYKGGAVEEVFIGTKRQYEDLGKRFGTNKRIGSLVHLWPPGRQKNLMHADLRGADLSNKDLSGANLIAARLHRSNLTRSNLSRADMFEAMLQYADLRSAVMRDTRLEGADLIRAKLDGADLAGAIYDVGTRWPMGFDPKAHGANLVPPQPGHSRVDYLIPRGYVGWLRIEFGVRGHPSLERRSSGYYVARFPSSGRIRTSTPHEFSLPHSVSYWLYDHHGRVPLDSKRKMWGITVGSHGSHDYQQFFVGTRSQYDSFPSNKNLGPLGREPK